MRGQLDAVVTAGGRLPPSAAHKYGTEVKALVRVGEATILRIVLQALHGVAEIRRIVVVGPQSAHFEAGGLADECVDEGETGDENLFRGLAAVGTGRALVCASDLPFVAPEHIAEFLARVPSDADAAYPIFRDADFLREFAGGRSRFARLADGNWTGGSAVVVDAPLLLRKRSLVGRVFRLRKQLFGLAALFGPRLLARSLLRRARVPDFEARASQMLGANVRAVIGAHPALAMDCDDGAELDFAVLRAGALRGAADRIGA